MDRDNTTILIDGYNYIGTIHGIVASRLRQQRDGLVAMLRRYYRYRGIRVIVVFDSHDDVHVWNNNKVSGVQVRFTPPGMIADDWIVQNLRKLPGFVGVVTDDRELRKRIRRQGGFWVSCQDFKDAVQAFHAAYAHVQQRKAIVQEQQVQENVPGDEDSDFGVQEHDSGVWDMFVESAGVQPLREQKRRTPKPKVQQDAAHMIEAMTRVTGRVVREKQAGLQQPDSGSKSLSRDEAFRKRQVAFLSLLRGLDISG